MLLRLPAALITLVSLAAVVTAACSGINPSDVLMSRTTNPRCGSDPTPEEIAENEAITASLVALDECADPFTAPVNNFTIPIFFNVIYAGPGPAQGNVT